MRVAWKQDDHSYPSIFPFCSTLYVLYRVPLDYIRFYTPPRGFRNGRTLECSPFHSKTGLWDYFLKLKKERMGFGPRKFTFRQATVSMRNGPSTDIFNPTVKLLKTNEA